MKHFDVPKQLLQYKIKFCMWQVIFKYVGHMIYTLQAISNSSNFKYMIIYERDLVDLGIETWHFSFFHSLGWKKIFFLWSGNFSNVSTSDDNSMLNNDKSAKINAFAWLSSTHNRIRNFSGGVWNTNIFVSQLVSPARTPPADPRKS